MSRRDQNDLYTFTLTEQRSSLDVNVTNIRRGTNVALELFTIKGNKQRVLRRIGGIDFSRLTARQRRTFFQPVARSDRGGNSSEAITITGLAAGDYYMRVQFRSGRRNANYSISGFANADLAGESLAAARPISADGTLFGDYVGISDNSDYYRFNVPSFRNVAIALSGLGADANLRLLDAAGNQIAASGNGGTADETISTTLTGGDYFLEVNPVPGAATTYQVGVTTTGFPDGGANTPPGTPIAVDFNRRFLTDLVTDDDPNDYYTFNLPYAATFELTLSGLTANADIRLFNALDGRQVASATSPGTSNETILIRPIDPNSSNPFPVLAEGSYYIQVSQGGTGQNTPYRLDYYALPAIDGAGNRPLPGVARDINANLNSSSAANPARFADFVGGVDDNDYYTFTVPSGGSRFFSATLNIPITGANTNVDLELLKAEGSTYELIASSSRAGSNSESFGGNLAPGTYYLRAFPATPEQGAFYQLSVFARDARGIPAIARDISPGDTSSRPDQLTVVGNNKVFFVAEDGTDRTLWQADGSFDPGDLGTLQSIKKVTLNTNLTDITNLVSGRFAGSPVLYFTASSATTGLALWRTDGTAEGTQALLSVEPAGATGFRGKPINVNGVLYFLLAPTNSILTNTLWRTDGTVAGTVPIALPDEMQRNLITRLTAIDNTLYFSAATAANGRELWRLDNTATTPQLIDVDPATSIGVGGETLGESSDPQGFVKFNNAVYFTAQTEATGRELWKYSPTSGAVQRLTDFNGAASSFDDDDSPNFTVFKNELYFTANGINPSNSTLTGTELFKVNIADTVSLAGDINLIASGVGSNPANLTVVRDAAGNDVTLFMTADDGVRGREIWRYNGTAFQPMVNVNTLPGVGSEPQNLINVNGTLYFSARGTDSAGVESTGIELWKVNPAGALEFVLDVLPGAEGSNPGQFVEVLGRLFFVANNGNALNAGSGFELWVI